VSTSYVRLRLQRTVVRIRKYILAFLATESTDKIFSRSIKHGVNTHNMQDPLQVSRKRPNSVVLGNCHVKKISRILPPIAKSATVFPPVVPLMDAGSSIYSYLRSIEMEHCEQFAPVCSSKCSSSKPVEMLGHEPQFINALAIFAFKTVHDKVLQQVKAMTPVTHVAIGTLRESPLYKSTGIEGDSHFLAYPARLTVKKALKAFLEQKNNSEKGTFVVNRHTSNIGTFKD
jgi:hypothetical protein